MIGAMNYLNSIHSKKDLRRQKFKYQQSITQDDTNMKLNFTKWQFSVMLKCLHSGAALPRLTS